MIAPPPTAVAAKSSAPAKGRGLVPRLESPHPLAASLPGLLQDDPFAIRLTGALDEVLAPIFSTLDNLETYFDPWLAPEDFLDWLGTWVGLTLDETIPLASRRAFVAHAYDLFRIRGTVEGLRRHVEIFTGGRVEIEDTGAVATSTTSASALPGSPNFAVLVRVIVEDPDAISRGRLEALVATAKPAHVTHRIEIVKRVDVSEHVEVTAG